MKTLKKLVEAFKRGEEKAKLERSARGAPHLAGSGPRFMEWVNEVYAPYDTLKVRADAIAEPKGFLERYAFRYGYKKRPMLNELLQELNI